MRCSVPLLVCVCGASSLPQSKLPLFLASNPDVVLELPKLHGDRHDIGPLKGDSFEDNMERTQTLFMVAFIIVAAIVALVFLTIFCKVIQAFRSKNSHAGVCMTPVVVSLPPGGLENTGSMRAPPPYSPTLPTAPPPYGFNPEINTGNTDSKGSYF